MRLSSEHQPVWRPIDRYDVGQRSSACVRSEAEATNPLAGL